MAFPNYATTAKGDTGNRADENPLSGSGRWENYAGSGLAGPMKLVSGEIVSAGTAGQYVGSSWKRERYTDCELIVKLTATNSGEGKYLKRVQNAADGGSPVNDPGQSGYLLTVDELGGGTWKIYRVDNGTSVSISTTVGGHSVAAGDQIGLEIVGNVVKGYKKIGAGAWTLVITATADDTYKSGYLGYVQNSNNNKIDDVAVGGITTGISFDSGSKAKSAFAAGGGTTLSWSHTVGSGRYRCLVVAVASTSATGPNTVTYGGVPMTLVGTSAAANVLVEWWVMLNPVVGTATVAVTMFSACRCLQGFGLSYFGVQSYRAAPAYVTANNASPDVTVTSVSGDLVVDCLMQWHSTTTPGLTPNSGQIMRNTDGNTDTVATMNAAVSEKTAASTSVFMDWISNESDLWLDAGIALVPADVLPVIPTRGVLDSFNRADTTTAGLGSAWTAIGAQTPRILSNAASTSATAGYDEGWLNTFAATQDVELWGTVKAGSNSTDGMYLSWRLRGPSGTGDPTTNWNGYVFRISSALSQKPMIRRWNGGAWTDVWFGTEAAAAGDTYIIRHVGSRLEVWRRREQMFTAGVWVKICDQLESGYVWQGRIGLGLTPNESGKWEEFGGGSAPTPNWYTVAGGNNLGVDFTSATSVAKTLDGPVAVGDLIVVAMSRSCSSNDVASDTCADSLGNVYTRGGGGFETFDAGGLSWFWSKATVAGWPTVTVTFPNSQPNRIIACQVYRSTAGVAFDVSASLSVNSDLAGSGPDNLTVGPITPTVNGDLIVAGFGQYSNLNPAYSGTMWTEDENSGVATLSYVIVESKVQEVAAALSGVATDQGSAGRYLGFVSAFKPSGGYVPAVPRQTAIVRAMRML